MFQWVRELLEIRYEFRERKLRLEEEKTQSEKICSSCEVLRMALDRANHEKEQLLSKILNPPKEEEVKEANEPLPIKSRHIPWRVRQQMLEEEDRVKAKVLQEHQENLKEANKASIQKLESKLGIANETN